MNNCINKIVLVTLILFSMATTSCKKFLDEKPDKKLSTAATLNDLQALLDRYSSMNNSQPVFGEVGSDDYYLTATDFNAMSEGYRRLHTWQEDGVYPNIVTHDWGMGYTAIYTANTVLENAENIPVTVDNREKWNSIKGQGYFHRADKHFALAVVFTKAYNPATASIDLGLPLRLNTNVNEVSVRSSVEATYTQIIRDLEFAMALLPPVQVNNLRATQPAAMGLLARVYLLMGKYDSCAKYAAKALQLNNTLINYNSINANATFPFTKGNAEVAFDAYSGLPPILDNSKAKIDSSLYNSYAANDLRKTIFFRSIGNGTFGFKGSYSGDGNLFSGISNNEMYLMLAEANARLGKTTEALQLLNTLLRNRYKTGTFTDVTAVSAADALNKILIERRKELVMRAMRWMDVKRLNVAGAAIIMKRKINNTDYTLLPNDNRYAMPLPNSVIEISGMPQNPR